MEVITRVGGPNEADLLDAVYVGKTAEEIGAEPLIDRWWQDVDKVTAECLRAAIIARNADDIAHYSALIPAIELLRATWGAYINNGKLAADTIAKLRDRRERVSRFKWEKRSAV